ncbi:tetratricopeptide repeat protein [Shewanella glacialipiscicola]|uniref:tetratricopeptide repeat protein n=1 Tax=Shewanella glacialipiscicola TaxID=614069 RepID=UPI0021DB1FF1|nr:tetratricopeptide repeat protein [Shewanella glacialipiscicola]MCU7995124.1 tetratricopeptide repeat protein [Shewanella glacialipiscicola]MCU8027063.1 tetratricopeptide repeat protein [Shewanella glacialipiscicola]
MEHILSLTKDNIQQVVDTSMQQIVVLAFWAQPQEESVAMLRTLEQIATQNTGRFVLAKVDCEAELEIANYFRIQSLPTTLVLDKGQPVDGFAGVQDSAQVMAMLDKYLPPMWQLQLAQAKELLALSQVSAEDLATATVLLKEAQLGSNQAGEVSLVLADVYLMLGELTLAQAMLDKVGLADQDGYYQSLKAKLTLALDAADTPEIRDLQQKFEQNPSDLVLLLELSKALHAAHRDDEALALLFEVLRQDLSAENGAVKQTFMEILTALGQGNPIASQYRRKLYTLLY